ncbi:MAG: transglutaminase domain-containing protein [Deltaproteobacteria bacterium]|nr:transglutaminase domain-containing protein [Deltaproteobacteria bacterium]MBM4322912.1 transglutaminase domain-containing protein [Deltaproteobacteria bacterium]MBM4347160.1 transglutaminase domain-containing protein [Deltaproteobacteria bacterium]
MEDNDSRYLAPTEIIDGDHKIVREFARDVVGNLIDPIEMVIKLYLAVRDGIRYDPYSPFYLPKHYSASFVLKRGRSFCIPKASLLCALARACGIPARVGLATVRNHLATKQLIDFLGSDLFISHGFVELYLRGKWLKATPAFNRELCIRHHVSPLEFNGQEDSIFQPYNLHNKKFMEYLEIEGIFTDIPVEHIVTGWKRVYGEDRVNRWIKAFEEAGEGSLSDFEAEDVLDD